MIKVDLGNRVTFNNNMDYCVGTGRMGLALQQEYMNQLRKVQKDIGFKHIRGHGLFSDDMAIYQEFDFGGERHVSYNFTYLDLVMDNYKSVGLKPFLELGFMPKKMASGDNTIFYWKGNTTPPKSYDDWCALIIATLSHLKERYGDEEVVTWPIEVWNEPNLPGFWKDANMEEYFKLFKYSFEAIKKYDSRFKVGGPAICGVKDEYWIREFMNFCNNEGLEIDFVTRHHYTTLPHEFEGRCQYAALEEAEDKFNNLHSTREIVDSFEKYKGLPIHITEYNTSYTPICVIHDTNLNAAFIAQQLSRLGDDNASYSYWTFGDIFEEMGVPSSPFHGGFGMLANRSIPKPTFYTFRYFKRLTGECVFRNADCIITKEADGSIRGMAWNINEAGKMNNNGKTSEDNKCTDLLKLDFEIGELKGDWCLLTETVDEETCNPLKVWHDLGEPTSLTEEQTGILLDAAKPFIKTERFEKADGISFGLDVKKNGIIYFELKSAVNNGGSGYNYNRAMGI